MKQRTRIVVVSLIVVAVVITLAITRSHGPSAQPANTFSYFCNAGKTIEATFNDSGSVDVRLSDGRSMTLAQTVSASGARYVNADESFVFWNKGNGALVLENNVEKSYIGCVEVVPEPEGSKLSQVYANGSDGFSIRFPKGYVADASYEKGVKFTIPASLAAGTNLSNDTYISVEQIPKAVECSAKLFTDSVATSTIFSDNDIDYSFLSSSDAGAGNRYEEQVYAIPGTKPCVAVRYLVHYGVIENYPEGKVKEFDKKAILEQFDQIRRTLTINQ